MAERGPPRQGLISSVLARAGRRRGRGQAGTHVDMRNGNKAAPHDAASSLPASARRGGALRARGRRSGATASSPASTRASSRGRVAQRGWRVKHRSHALTCTRGRFQSEPLQGGRLERQQPAAAFDPPARQLAGLHAGTHSDALIPRRRAARSAGARQPGRMATNGIALEGLAYRELQRMCKDLGLPAKGA